MREGPECSDVVGKLPDRSGGGFKPSKCVYTMHNMSPSKGVYWEYSDTVVNPELIIP